MGFEPPLHTNRASATLSLSLLRACVVCLFCFRVCVWGMHECKLAFSTNIFPSVFASKICRHRTQKIIVILTTDLILPIKKNIYVDMIQRPKRLGTVFWNSCLPEDSALRPVGICWMHTADPVWPHCASQDEGEEINKSSSSISRSGGVSRNRGITSTAAMPACKISKLARTAS